MNNARYRPDTGNQALVPGTQQGTQIALNFPLLFSALGAIVAVLALLLGQQAQNTGFLYFLLFIILPFVIVVAVVINMIYVLYSELTIGWQDRQRMTEICNSVLLASFLMGVISLVYIAITATVTTTVTTLPLPLGVISVALSVFPLAGLLLNVQLQPVDSYASRLLQAKEQIALLEDDLSATERQLQKQLQAGKVSNPDARKNRSSTARGNQGTQGSPLVLPQGPDSKGVALPEPALDTSLIPPRPAQQFAEDPQSYVPVQLRRTWYFTMSKTNNLDPIQNEDMCVISPNENSFALCDGASGSQLPRPWGFFLGQQWLKQPLYDETGSIPADLLLKWLKDPRQNWAYWVAHSWRPSTPASNEIKNRILGNGAAATLLGLRVDNVSWYATAVGDSCLFHISAEGKTQLVMPLTRSTDFSQTPPLLSSRGENELRLLPFIQCKSSTYRQHDILLMATDALSRWILLQHERGVSPWQQLYSLQSQEEFERFIRELRREEQIEVDDTTMVVIQL